MTTVGEVVRTTGFASWIKRVPGRGPANGSGVPANGSGATVVFPHAGGVAAGYRALAAALAARGRDVYLVQYPHRADRWREPAADTVPELARGLFDAGCWAQVAPLRLFGHSMGALVAFEFARIAEASGVAVAQLWASAGPAPSTVAARPALPTDHAGLLADIADLGGTDARLLADDEFAELLTGAVRGDYRAVNRYDCPPGRAVGADIHVIGARSDHRVDADTLHRWAQHTTGACTLSWYDGGHFYLNDHLDAVADQVNDDGR